MEVIKEWNTSSRGGNPESRNRAEPVEEGKGTITVFNISDRAQKPASLKMFCPNPQPPGCLYFLKISEFKN